MLTGIGALFLGVGLYFAIRKPDFLFPFLLFSTIFPATSAITFGSLWIMPYYVLAPVFLVSELCRSRNRFSQRIFAGKTLLVAFGCAGVISSLLFPLLFAGIPVYSPRLGTTDEVFSTFPLVFSIGNVAQAGYLAVNILVVLAAAQATRTDRIWRGLNATFYTLTGTILLELVCLLAGIPFPYPIIENTPARSSMEFRLIDPSQRLQGTCGEPSYAGLILVIFVAAYFYRYYAGKGGGWKTLIGVVSIFLVRSSSAMIALVVVIAAIIALNSPIRFPMLVRAGRFKRLIPMIAAVVLCISSSAFMLLMQQWIFDKPTSGSYAIRTTADNYSIDLLMRTYGIGVGIGSYRPSSLVASLAGNIGVLGSLMFVLVVLQIGMAVRPDRLWIRWSLCAGLIDMSLAIPDITHPILWSMLAFAVYAGGASPRLEVARSFRRSPRALVARTP